MKKIFFPLLTFCALSASAQTEIIVGDMNGDGVLSIEDVTLLTSTILGERDIIIHKCYADEDDFTAKSFTVNGVTFKMIPVEHGTFEMGCDDFYGNEGPVHSVTLSNDYYIGETEVTQGLWYAVMEQKPTSDGSLWSSTYGLGDNYPAYNISWDDCQGFITKLNQLTGQSFRMPTEAEWEFAAKGGNKSKGYTYSGSNTIDDVAWLSAHEVATKLSNELGVYDMSGNVTEWCNDWYGSSYYSNSPAVDPEGVSYGSNRMARAGEAFNDSRVCRGNSLWGGESDFRVAARNCEEPSVRAYSIGLRLALTASALNSDNDDSGTGNQDGDGKTHEYVDLGLPSGTLWATCNIGAENPEDYGYYFAWGEVEPKSTYNWSTYFDTDDDGSTFETYNNKGGQTELAPANDAACVNWGPTWCVPTVEQMEELRDNCELKWMQQNNVYGFLMTSKSNGNTIFLPAPGRYADSELAYQGSSGNYWTRTFVSNGPSRAYGLSIASATFLTSTYYRYLGFAIRPVRK